MPITGAPINDLGDIYPVVLGGIVALSGILLLAGYAIRRVGRLRRPGRLTAVVAARSDGHRIRVLHASSNIVWQASLIGSSRVKRPHTVCRRISTPGKPDRTVWNCIDNAESWWVGDCRW